MTRTGEAVTENDYATTKSLEALDDCPDDVVAYADAEVVIKSSLLSEPTRVRGQ